MNTYFSAGDWAIICLYLLGIIGLGLWFGKDQHNTRDYFLGSKNVPWWAIGSSIVAAETSALTVIGVPGLAFGGDIGLVQMIIGYVIARIILAVVLVPHYFKGEIYSPYQLFANAFGPSARQTAGGFFLLSETLAAGVRVYVASIPVKLMLGESCQAPPASCQVVYEYQDPNGSALVNARDAASVTVAPGWIVCAGREGVGLV